MFTPADINYDSTAIIERHGFTLTLSTEYDQDHGAPWDEECGHGPVSDWTTRDKQPGELILSSDRQSHRFYDYAEACRIARCDGWGTLAPYTLQMSRSRNGAHVATAKAPRYGKGSDLPELVSKRRDINRAVREVYAAYRATFPSPRAYAAAAARADYDRLRAWCNNDWNYMGVIVTASRNDIELGSASLWGIESNCGADYICAVANELIDEALSDARSTLESLP